MAFHTFSSLPPPLQVSEEMEEKARELRGEAMMAAGEGDLEKVVELFTSAILSNPKSALLYAKRARYIYEVLLLTCCQSHFNLRCFFLPLSFLCVQYICAYGEA